MQAPSVSFVSLGCPKNLVDSEKMLGLLAAAIGTSRLVPLVPRALAAKTQECFQLQPFGDWKGVASGHRFHSALHCPSMARSSSRDFNS